MAGLNGGALRLALLLDFFELAPVFEGRWGRAKFGFGLPRISGAGTRPESCTRSGGHPVGQPGGGGAVVARLSAAASSRFPRSAASGRRRCAALLLVEHPLNGRRVRV